MNTEELAKELNRPLVNLGLQAFNERAEAVIAERRARRAAARSGQ